MTMTELLTATPAQRRAALIADAESVRKAFRANNHTPSSNVRLHKTDPTEIQQRALDALTEKMTVGEVATLTGMSEGSMRYLLRELEKKGRVQRHPTKPISWSKI